MQQIKDKLSIVDVVSQYVKLERAGSSFKGRCPFHSEKTPSFFVSPDRGTYHCFGCDVGGDMFTFIQEIEGIDFKGALQLLADKAGVQVVYERGEKKDARDKLYTLIETATLFFIRELDEKHKARAYLHERGIVDETIQSFRIGFAPDSWSALLEHLKEKGYTQREIEIAGLVKKGERGVYDRFRSRIMFPIMDSAGRVVAFSGRHLETRDSDVLVKKDKGIEPAKYINSPETPLFRKSHILYGYDRARQHIRKLNFSILVEGQMDLISSHQAGWPNTIAVSGTALTEHHITLLKRMSDNLLIALDADAAGVAAATKSARSALKAGMEVKVAELPEGMDPSDLIQKEGKGAWKSSIKKSKHIITFLLDVLERNAKDERHFQKSVERVVLPFLHSTENPLDKESFKRVIAERLNVSESAIDAAMNMLPKEDSQEEYGRAEMKEVKDEKKGTLIHPRVRQLWGVILWQKNIKKPHIDVREVEKRLFEIIGKETAIILNAMNEAEKQKLLFAVESVYGGSGELQKSTEEFLRIIEEDILKQKLIEATIHIRTAENKGDTEKEAQLKEAHKIYTDRLAELRKRV